MNRKNLVGVDMIEIANLVLIIETYFSCDIKTHINIDLLAVETFWSSFRLVRQERYIYLFNYK